MTGWKWFLLIVFAMICFIVWMYLIVAWDGSEECDPSPEECSLCPFPCERHIEIRR